MTKSELEPRFSDLEFSLLFILSLAYINHARIPQTITSDTVRHSNGLHVS